MIREHSDQGIPPLHGLKESSQFGVHSCYVASIRSSYVGEMGLKTVKIQEDRTLGARKQPQAQIDYLLDVAPVRSIDLDVLIKATIESELRSEWTVCHISSRRVATLSQHLGQSHQILRDGRELSSEAMRLRIQPMRRRKRPRKDGGNGRRCPRCIGNNVMKDNRIISKFPQVWCQVRCEMICSNPDYARTVIGY